MATALSVVPATMDQTEINDIKEALESKNANLDNINEENTSGDSLNKIDNVGEQKFNAPLHEASPAPSFPNS